MRKNSFPISAILLFSLLLAACSRTAEPQPLRLGAAPWQAGESATYAVAGNESETTGAALFGVSGGGESWELRSEISAAGDREVSVVETGVTGFRPRNSSLVRQLAEGGLEQVRATYDAGVATLELTTRDNVTTFEQFNLPTDSRDQRSLPFLVRALPLADGYAARINTFLPITGILDRYTVTVVEREEVTVPAGTFDAWRVQLDTGEIVSQIWIGVDAPHPIVQFDDGRANATYALQSFAPGGE